MSSPDHSSAPNWTPGAIRFWTVLFAIGLISMASVLTLLAWGQVSGDGRIALLIIVAGIGLIAAAGTAVIFRLVRERQKFQSAARELDRLHRTALPKLTAMWEKAPMSLFLLDSSDPKTPVKIVDCNPMACQLHGYSRDELIGKSIDMVEATPWTHNVKNWIEQFRQTPRFTGESEHRRKDGTRFWVDYCTGLVVLDGHQYVIGMDRDATARKHAEQSLRISEERWQLAVAGSNEGVWDWDIATNAIWFSARWKSMLGFEEGEMPDERSEWLMRIHPDDRLSIETALKAHLRRQADIFHCEYRILHRDGHWIWALVRGKALFDDKNRATRMVGTHTDITRQKEAEAELRSAKEAAEAADRAKSEFLAVMSHEIRTPMNGVLGFTNLLLDTALGAEQRDWLVTIRTSGESLLTLINDILDFSKIESGRMELDQHPVCIRRSIEEVMDMLWSKAKEKKIELLHWIDGDVPEWLLTDSTRLRQVLVNLVGNAIKFTARGEVEVRVSLGAATTDRACQLVFQVRDTGEGIPTDRIDRLFRPFSQADSSTTRKHGGTGLGLAISRSLAQLLGGNIELAATSPQGSTFRFSIQAEVTAAPPEQEFNVPVITPAIALGGRRALIVDDNECNRRILTCQLQRWGLVSDCFESPSAALAHLNGPAVYDLAILDMMMPEMNGIELAAAVHHVPGREQLPLILLSSVNREELRAYRPNTHFKVVLTKPIRQALLLDALNKTLAETPASTVPSAAPVKPTSTPPKFDPNFARQHPLRIIVAEDNPVNQKLISGLLRRLGYQPHIEGNGATCLEALRREQYDLVLMDCQMPEMDGLDASSRIRKGEAGDHNRDIHIIALTASAMVGDRERCIKAGMSDYLTKPIQAAELIRRLSEHQPKSANR